jgi:hypothetical protein
VAHTVGAMNPRALAQLVLGQRINWDRVEEPRRLLEVTLGLPYDRLFDPVHSSPLYLGVGHRPDHLGARLPAGEGLAPLTFHGREVAYDEGRLREILAGLLTPPDDLWTPEGVTWTDPGTFFIEGTEFSDPVQGALPDSHLVAALGAVAWARPFLIAHRTRPAGIDDRRFIDMVLFHTDDAWHEVVVTEELPLTTRSNSWRYARSPDPGEIWPAIYEKAYAKWKCGTTTDRPDYGAIAGGDPALALRELTDLEVTTTACAELSAEQLLDLVQEHCDGQRAVDPLVAWTYPTGARAPEPVVYGDADLVAGHAYTVLGWYEDRVVLRNPWGFRDTGGEAEEVAGDDWWRAVARSGGGVFALEAGGFRRFFGWVAAGR